MVLDRDIVGLFRRFPGGRVTVKYFYRRVSSLDTIQALLEHLDWFAFFKKCSSAVLAERMARTRHARRFDPGAIAEILRDDGQHAPFPVRVTFNGRTYHGVVVHPTTVLIMWNGQGSSAPNTLKSIIQQDPKSDEAYSRTVDLAQGGDIYIEFVSVSDQVKDWANHAYQNAEVDENYSFEADSHPHPSGCPAGLIPDIPKFTPSGNQSVKTKFRDVPTKMRRPDVTGILPCDLANCGGATRGCVIPPGTIIIHYCGYASNNFRTLGDHNRCVVCTVDENKTPQIKVGAHTTVTFTAISEQHAAWCNAWVIYDRHNIQCKAMRMSPLIPVPSATRPSLHPSDAIKTCINVERRSGGARTVELQARSHELQCGRKRGRDEATQFIDNAMVVRVGEGGSEPQHIAPGVTLVDGADFRIVCPAKWRRLDQAGRDSSGTRWLPFSPEWP